jgi:hypothetical protein
MVKYELVSSWKNKAAALKESAFYREHGVPARVVKAGGFSTAWNCWIKSGNMARRK